MERNSWTLMLGKKEQCATPGCQAGKIHRRGRCVECHRAKQRIYQKQMRIKRKAGNLKMKPKKKRCKSCKEQFTPFRPLQSCCSVGCAISHGQEQTRKKALKEASEQRTSHRVAKIKAKTRAQWMKEAQAAWNAFRRTEDGIARGGKCISCGTTNGKQNCGHYRSVGSNPSIRFDPINTWLQCERCNTHLHSNAIEFRLALAKILTKEQLEWLEGNHEPKKYSIEELKEIIRTSKLKLKEITR